MGRVYASVKFANPRGIEEGRREKMVKERALVDTGATFTTVPRSLAKKLALPIMGKVKVRTASGEEALDQSYAYTEASGKSTVAPMHRLKLCISVARLLFSKLSSNAPLTINELRRYSRHPVTILGPRSELTHSVYELGLEDVAEVVSLIAARQATHGLFILHNVSPVPSLGSRAARLRALHSEILDYIELSDDNMMELLGLSELSDDKASDLMKYTERLRIKLKDTIDPLLRRKMPSEDEQQKQRQAEYKKALTEF